MCAMVKTFQYSEQSSVLIEINNICLLGNTAPRGSDQENPGLSSTVNSLNSLTRRYRKNDRSPLSKK